MQTKPTGRLGTATLPRVVQDLWRTRASGILHLSQDPANKRVYFRKGDIVFAGTNLEHERLGERLVREGKISRSVLDLAFRVVERSHERFGKTIVEMGWVSPQEMQQRVAEQIKDIIFSVFTWESGEYRFERSDNPVDPDLALELQTAEVIYEGVRRISDLRSIRVGIGSYARILELANGKRLDIPINKEDGYILSKVNGVTSISQILGGSPLTQEETLRRIYALLLADVLRIGNSGVQAEPHHDGADTPTNGRSVSAKPNEADEAKRFRNGAEARYAAMKIGSLYDRLEVDAGASTERIREAYQSVMKAIEPGPSLRANVVDLQPRLEKMRRKVVDAYKTLSDPERRRDYDLYLKGTSPDATAASVVKPKNGTRESSVTMASRASSTPFDSDQEPSPRERAKRDAEPHYIDAKRNLDAGLYFEAIGSLNEAIRLDPNNGKYHRLLGQLLAQNPSCAKASQQHFLRAIEIDPYDTSAYLGLADLFEDAGLAVRARKVYQKVITIEPENEVALRKLNGIASLPSLTQKMKGLFGR
jgi:tetratricopeptide (TPR) repeat protein